MDLWVWLVAIGFVAGAGLLVRLWFYRRWIANGLSPTRAAVYSIAVTYSLSFSGDRQPHGGRTQQRGRVGTDPRDIGAIRSLDFRYAPGSVRVHGGARGSRRDEAATSADRSQSTWLWKSSPHLRTPACVGRSFDSGASVRSQPMRSPCQASSVDRESHALAAKPVSARCRRPPGLGGCNSSCWLGAVLPLLRHAVSASTHRVRRVDYWFARLVVPANAVTTRRNLTLARALVAVI